MRTSQILQEALLLERLKEPVMVSDLEGRVLRWNRAAEGLLVAEGGGMEGSIWLDFLGDAGGRKAGLVLLDTAIREGSWQGPLVWRVGMGPERSCETLALALKTQSGEVSSVMLICHEPGAHEHAERQLVNERLLLRALIDTVPDPIFCKDRHGRFLIHNLADQKMFNAENGEFLGKTVFECPGLKENAEVYYADDMRVIDSGEPVLNREEPYVTPGGFHGWYLTSKYPLRHPDGEIYGLVGIARDITHIKQTNDELARTRQRLIDHVENSPLAVIEFRSDLMIERWGGQATRIFGWSAGEVIGKPVGDYPRIDEKEAGRVGQLRVRLLEGGEERSVCQSRSQTKSGEWIHCVWHYSALRGVDGRIVSILALVEDVTQRVLAEQAMRESERLYRLLIETTNTGYTHCDETGAVLDANAEFVRLTGYTTLSQIHGMSIYQFVAGYDLERTTQEFQRLRRVGYSRDFELDFCTPEGAIIPIEANVSVREMPNGVRILAFWRDISGRRKIAQERQAMERKLLESQKLESLGLLAGGIAHDFNNLLTGVLGNASLARMDAGPDSFMQAYLEQIETAASRAADLCRQMLAYSGKGSFVVSRVNLNEMVEETVHLVNRSLSKKVKVKSELAAGLPAIVGDVTQLRQVVMNLVINAGEAIGDKEGWVELRTSVVNGDELGLATADLAPDLPSGRYVCLEVRDSGCGMDAKVRARIFDPFFTTKPTGRGLGLASVLGIVRGHHGALSVSSEPGEGTCFRVSLPCTEEAVAPQPEGGKPVESWRGSGWVLVVDDEPMVRVTTTHMLEALGFRVIEASDGQEGIDRFVEKAEDLALVILDLSMPKVDGEEMLREIRGRSSEAPVLLMSGFDESEVLSRFAGLKFSGFLQKPFRLAALREKVRQIVGSP